MLLSNGRRPNENKMRYRYRERVARSEKRFSHSKCKHLPGVAVSSIFWLGARSRSLAYAGKSVCSCDSCTIDGGSVQLDNQFIVRHTHIPNICVANVGG